MKPRHIHLEGLVVIVGNYGSGKTEISINLAIENQQAGGDVRVADLDLVNPYFRTREVRHLFARLGIDLVLPAEELLQADLPIVSPLIAGMVRQPSRLTLIDVGGDDAGATVLAALADAFKDRDYQMLQVVNPMRPYTDTIAGCLKIRSEIETAARLSISGLVGNANLIDETTPDVIIRGYEFVVQLSEESGLPLHFVTAAADLLPDIDTNRISCPVLAIRRQLVPPWEKAYKI
jgi:hypothetical protein